jgi:hypothetical protein
MDVDVATLFLFPNVVLGYLQVTLTTDATKGHFKETADPWNRLTRAIRSPLQPACIFTRPLEMLHSTVHKLSRQFS